MFQGLPQCSYLLLQHNNISEIHEGAFNGLTALTYLELKNNALKTLRPGTFFGLNSLRYLFLDGNQLTTILVDVFSHLSRPLLVGLQSNPVQCDDDLCWLKSEEKASDIVFVFREHNSSSMLKPECTDGRDWDAWVCHKKGMMCLSVF